MRTNRISKSNMLAIFVTMSIAISSCSSSSGGENPAEPEQNGKETASLSARTGSIENVADLSEIKASPCELSEEFADLEVKPVCYTVTVPEQWDDPDPQDTVELAVAVFESGTDTKTNSKADAKPSDDADAETNGAPGTSSAMVYLDGGPGGHTLDAVQFSFENLIEPHLQSRDFIVFDQRGVGLSEPSLSCPEVTEAEFVLQLEAGDDDVEQKIFLDGVEKCQKRLAEDGVDLTSYNSIASANDLEAIRTLLEYQELNLIGVSYGTRLAQTFMRMYPDSVRAAVLDAIVPNEVNFTEAIVPNALKAFDHLFASCQQDEDCNETYPNLEDRFYALADKLDTEPINFPVQDSNGEAEIWEANGDDLMGTLFSMLYSRSDFSAIPQMIEQIEDGNYAALETLGSLEYLEADYFSSGMYLSVECNEEISFETANTTIPKVTGSQSKIDRFEAIAESGDLGGPCEVWQAGNAPEIENEKLETYIPSLLLGGRFDPVTPADDMKLVAAGLTNSFSYVFAHEGHGVSTTECGSKIVKTFLDDPTVEPDASCIEDTTRPPFTPGSFEDIVLTKIEIGESPTISVETPKAWEELAQGILLKNETTFDQTAIAIGPAFDLNIEQVQAQFEFTYRQQPDYEDSTGRTWKINRTDDLGYPELLAFNDQNGGVWIRLLANSDDDLAKLYDSVLTPALDSVTLSE